jgi:hypothetical protein
VYYSAVMASEFSQWLEVIVDIIGKDHAVMSSYSTDGVVRRELDLLNSLLSVFSDNNDLEVSI